MSDAARRACVCRSQFLFVVVQWATVPARAADPIKVSFSMALTRALRRSR